MRDAFMEQHGIKKGKADDGFIGTGAFDGNGGWTGTIDHHGDYGSGGKNMSPLLWIVAGRG